MMEALDSRDFVDKMKLNAAPKIMKASMVLPRIEHSLELAQALAAGDQKSFLRRYREEWQTAVSDLSGLQDIEAFFKQLRKLTKYKNSSTIPDKVKRIVLLFVMKTSQRR